MPRREIFNIYMSYITLHLHWLNFDVHFIHVYLWLWYRSTHTLHLTLRLCNGSATRSKPRDRNTNHDSTKKEETVAWEFNLHDESLAQEVSSGSIELNRYVVWHEALPGQAMLLLLHLCHDAAG